MYEVRSRNFELTSAHLLFGAFVFSCAIAAILIGSFPLAASIVTIFIFAGVHNVMEFRYFVARMPMRWGRSRLYYSVGIGGVVVLTIAYLTLYFASGNWLWGETGWAIYSALWNTAFVMWIASMFWLRGRQRPKTDWSWAFPIAFFVSAIVWVFPLYWSLALVYIHPIIAMWFLERQIRRTKPEWLAAYHWCLASIPIFVAVLYFAFASQPNLPEDSNLFWRIAQHAGSQILPGISSHFLVATHVFLESIHYFVWILLIPLVDRRAIPWKLDEIPMFRGGGVLRRLVVFAFVFAILIVGLLWAGFSLDYTTTRDIYFAFAIGHVLAEFPFLIKML